MPSLDAMSYIMCKSHGLVVSLLAAAGKKKTLLFASFVMQTSIMMMSFFWDLEGKKIHYYIPFSVVEAGQQC